MMRFANCHTSYSYGGAYLIAVEEVLYSDCEVGRCGLLVGRYVLKVSSN